MLDKYFIYANIYAVSTEEKMKFFWTAIVFALVATPTLANPANSGENPPGLVDKGGPNGLPDPHETGTNPGKGDPRGRSPVDDRA
jgi:hypothetical protein